MNKKVKTNSSNNYPRIIIGGHNKSDTEFLKGNDKVLKYILQQ